MNQSIELLDSVYRYTIQYQASDCGMEFHWPEHWVVTIEDEDYEPVTAESSKSLSAAIQAAMALHKARWP